jgi:hypothetical protein
MRLALLTCLALFGLFACRSSDENPDTDETADTGTSPTVVELSPALCDDTSELDAVLDALEASGQSQMFGGANIEQFERMVAATLEPFYMFNLIHYREWAEYPDGRETDLTGREANALYAPTEYLSAIGAGPAYVTEIHDQIDGDDPVWDEIAIVSYPCSLAFLAMISNAGFQERAIHKDAGVEQTIAMVTDLVPLPAPTDTDLSDAPFPPTPEDPDFDLIQVMDFHDVAQYADGADEPERTGEEAWQLYQQSEASASEALGHYRTATLKVQGVFTGDDRDWDEIHMVHMTSLAGFEALHDDETLEAAQHHRTAALQHTYSMTAFPMLSQIPYADTGPGGEPPPVAADGTGQLCQSDADCPGNGVDFCLMEPGSPGGFCTRSTCSSGECASPYVCCRDCDPVVAASLPFEESTCLPDDVVGSLTSEPASCTCD